MIRQRLLGLGKPLGGFGFATGPDLASEIGRDLENPSRTIRLPVLPESLGQNQLVRRMARKRSRGGLGMNQGGFGIPRPGRPTRRPQQDQSHDTVASGSVEIGRGRDHALEEFHHDLETVDRGRRSFARLLAHGQCEAVVALRNVRVEADAMLADLDTLDGEFLAAGTVLFVLDKPGGGSGRSEKRLDRRGPGLRHFEEKGLGMFHRTFVRPPGKFAFGSSEDGIRFRELRTGSAPSRADLRDGRRFGESRGATEGHDQ